MKTQIQALEQANDLSADDSRKIFWAKNTLINLERKITHLKGKYATDFKWEEFNLSEYSTFNMTSKEAIFRDLHNLLDRVNALDSKINEAVRQNTQLDRSTNPPLSP